MRWLFKVVFIAFFLTISANAFNYNGTWFNTNANSSGVVKLIIKSNGTIRAYGKCHPNSCDWGRRYYTRVKSGLLASWRQRGIGHKVILVESAGVNRIKVVVKYLYCDSRSDKTRVEYFKKLPVVSLADFRDRFTGSWISTNPNTRSLTRAKLFKSGSGLYVHLWGKCHPRDCDWGSIRARVSSNQLKLTWNKGFVTRVMTIRGLNYRNGRYNKLRIKTTNYYNDSRGVRTTIEYMKRGY